MIEEKSLKNLLSEYDISYDEIIKKNKKVLTLGNEENIKKIIEFLLSIGIETKNIKNSPSILFLSDVKEIKKKLVISFFYITIAFKLLEPLLTILVAVVDNLYLVLSGIIESFA